MKEIGRELRQAREERGWELADVASRTMVALKHLQALEAGNWEVFSGEVYLKGALRKYAAEVGLDPRQVVAWYEDVMAKQAKPAAATQAIQAAVKQPPPERRKIIRVTTKRVKKRRLFLVLTVLALTILAVRFTYTLISDRPEDRAIQPPPLPQPTVPVEAPPAPTPDVPVIIPDQPPAEVPALRIERVIAPGTVSFKVYGAESLQATLSFMERCWVSVTSDGRQRHQQNFNPGQSYQVQAERSIRLRVGNPPGMSLVINGQTLEMPTSRRPYTLEIERE